MGEVGRVGGIREEGLEGGEKGVGEWRDMVVKKEEGIYGRVEGVREREEKMLWYMGRYMDGKGKGGVLDDIKGL